MAWVGLERYGYLEDAQRLAYRFLYMYVLFHAQVSRSRRLTDFARMTTAFVDFNGVVPEKVSGHSDKTCVAQPLTSRRRAV